MNKKILLISALSVLALTSCQKSDQVSDQPSSSLLPSSEAIGFNTYAARAVTKSDSSSPKIQQFNVEAFLTNKSTLYFPATVYRYKEEEGKYVGDTTRFWPANEQQHLDFYAVSPLKYVNNDNNELELKPTADLAIRVKKTNGETDIVAAHCTDASYHDGYCVELPFQHKLTKVSFTAVGSDKTKKYVIKELTLRANSTADYSFGDNWTIPENEGDPFDYCYVDEYSSETIPINTENPLSLGNAKYLIPNQGGSVHADIYYEVYYGETVICDCTGEKHVTLTLPATAWGVNKNVVYALTLGLSGANPIDFTTTLNEWSSSQSEEQPVSQ